MKTKILVTGLACLSVLAIAQQSEKKADQTTSHEIKAPRDAASGQASGRKADHTAASDASAGTGQREAGSGMPTGKTMAMDDWHSQATTTSGDPHVKNVSTGDTNSDQTMIRESPSKASTGLRESPSKSSTELRESPSKASLGKTAVAAGDVDGDGRADKAAASDGVKSSRDLATGQASGKRQHGVVKMTKEDEGSSPQK